jgi:transposase InsO family protein
MVMLVEERGLTFEQAAACSNVAKSTVWEWVRRWRQASAAERRSRSCLEDRPSRPKTSPRMLAQERQQRICEARRRTGWGPRLIASELGEAHSTVHATLRRHGVSRRPKLPREAAVRYEWPCPGDLLHMDVKRYPRFRRPGHAVTGDRSKTRFEKTHALGHDFFHAIVDDHSRLAYGELLADERAPTVAAFTSRALAWFAARGVRCRRVMTDGAWSYRKNRALAELLADNGVSHIVTPPYTPRWNGKVERFHQTMEREWAKGVRYRNSTARNQALPHWLNYYNERRRHSAIDNQPPISRVRNLAGQDS